MANQPASSAPQAPKSGSNGVAARDWQRAIEALDSGDTVHCRALCHQLLRDEPDSARVLWLSANAALQEGDFNAVLEHVRAVRPLLPSLAPEQMVAITRLLIMVGEFEAAWLQLAELRHRAPAGNVLLAVGEQLSMLERYPEALDCLRMLESRGTRHPMLSFLISSACRYTGDFAGAIEAAEATLRLQPDFAHAHWALSHLGAKADAPRRVDRIRKSLVSLGRRSDSRTSQLQSALAMLWHALFRELDALDDRTGAWLALSNGLALKRNLQPHDVLAENRLFDDLIDTYSPEFIQLRPGPTAGNPTPVFIVGMPRTGTTLIERIITNHGDAASCGELNELQLLVKRATGHWSPEFLDATTATRLRNANLCNLGDDYLQSVAWRVGDRPYMVDKHQSNFLLAGIIARCLPHARIIHVRRDPLDACFSNLKEPFAQHAYSYSNDQCDVANHYRNYERLMRHLHEVADEHILEVSYEALVRDHLRESHRILDFIGLTIESGLDDITRNRSPIASASSVQVREPIHDRNIGAWRRYSSQLEVLQVALDV